jgi:hypothetical protein
MLMFMFLVRWWYPCSLCDLWDALTNYGLMKFAVTNPRCVHVPTVQCTVSLCGHHALRFVLWGNGLSLGYTVEFVPHTL